MATSALEMGQTPRPAPTGPVGAVPKPPLPKPPGAPGAGGPMGGGLRVSLMPSDQEGGKRPDLTKRLLILVLVLVVESVIIGGVYLYLNQEAAKRQAEGTKLENELKSLSALIVTQEKGMAEATQFNKQIVASTEALNNHYYWTNFFAWLEKTTRSNIIYFNFSGDAESATVILDAKGKTYRDLAEQIIVFRQDPLVASFRHTAASLAMDREGKIEGALMSFALKLKPDAWKNTTAVPAVGAKPTQAATGTPAAATTPAATSPAAGTTK